MKKRTANQQVSNVSGVRDDLLPCSVCGVNTGRGYDMERNGKTRRVPLCGVCAREAK